jgi:chromosome segregation ATPase
VDLDEAVGELYALSPDDFTARRSELAAEARENGDRPLATEIGKLRRPTIAAWLTNLMARERRDDLVRLQALATEMREAHRELDGSRIRELSAQRQAVLQDLTDTASTLSDRKVGDSALQQVRETYDAAIADEGAEAAALSGQLTTALSYSGFGEVDLTEATALPSPRRHLRVVGTPPASTGTATTKPSTTTGKADSAGSQRRAATIAAAEAAVADAEQAASEWAHEAMTASSGLDRAKREHEQATARIEQLEDELATARTAAREAELALRARRREHDSAEQRLDQAKRKVRELQAKLDRLQH